MRSDNLKRHELTHRDILTMTDDEVREELRARNATRVYREENHQRIEEIAQQENIPIELCVQSSSSTLKTLEEELLQTNQEYLEKIELGKEIALIIDEGTVREESLKRSYKEALDLHRKQKPRIDIQTAQLRPWQEKLMKIISKPSGRTVFWVCGYVGNEGKSWFQSYIETFYGYARVTRLDLRTKTSNILYALSKRPLQTTDIFLFNDTRAVGETKQNYGVLEQIKDGCATSTKYNSNILNFKTPNIVVVFSNSAPNISYLSADRWRVYTIKEDGLYCTRQ